MHATARSKFISDGVGSTPPERLLVMLYDRLVRDLDDAAIAAASADVSTMHEALSHAQDIVAELHSALNPDAWEGAESMAELYTWLADLLARANVHKSAELVAESRSLVGLLRDTWTEAYESLPTTQSVAAVPAGGLDVAG